MTIDYSEAEIFSVILCLCVWLFLLFNWQPLVRSFNLRWPLISYLLLTLSLTSSVVEGLALPALFNLLQHLLSLCSVIVLCIWCWSSDSIFRAGVVTREPDHND